MDMKSVANIAVGIVALLHFYFMYLEMFFVEYPKRTKNFWADTRVLLLHRKYSQQIKVCITGS